MTAITPDTWPAVWALAQVWWPHDVAAGSEGVHAAWEAVLRGECGLSPQLVGATLESLALNGATKLPHLSTVKAEAESRRDREARAKVVKLPAPAEDRMSLEAFVTSMHVDRRRQHTEINDLVRKGLMSPAVAERNHRQIESVGPAEIAAYRDVAAGAWKSHATSMSLLMERASHAGESYPEVATFLAHENAEAVADVVPLPEQGGRDRAVPREVVVDIPSDPDEIQRRAEQVLSEMREHGSRSVDWHSIPAEVRAKAREIAAAEKAHEGINQ